MLLEEIKNRTVIKPLDWMQDNNEGLEIIITNVSPLMTNFLYQLMFLLEDRRFNGRVPEIYLLDNGQRVTDKDIRLGLFIGRDKGKNKAEVLMSRYSNTFTTTIRRVNNINNFIMNKKVTLREKVIYLNKKSEDYETTDKNTVIIGDGKQTEITDNLFKNLFEIKDSYGVIGTLVRMHGISSKNRLNIYNTVYRKQGDVVGHQVLPALETEKRHVTDLVFGNQMISETMIQFLNLLITNDEKMDGLQYNTWGFNVNEGTFTNEYITKTVTMFAPKSYRYLLKAGVTHEFIVQNEEKLKRELRKNRTEYLSKQPAKASVSKKTGQEFSYSTLLLKHLISTEQLLYLKLKNKIEYHFKSEKELVNKMVFYYVVIRDIQNGKLSLGDSQGESAFTVMNCFQNEGINIF